MTMIEKIRNKIKNLGADSAKRENELDKLRADLVALDEKRTKAIDADNYKLVEDLTRDRADMLLKIEAKEAINNRKNEQSVTREEIAAAWADDCSEYQKQIDKALKEYRQYIRQAAERAVVVCDLINAAWNDRVNALILANDTEPTTYNAGNRDFAGTEYNAAELQRIRPFFDEKEWQEIKPGALQTIGNATLNRINAHFHIR